LLGGLMARRWCPLVEALAVHQKGRVTHVFTRYASEKRGALTQVSISGL
jgi:hypothetical protein